MNISSSEHVLIAFSEAEIGNGFDTEALARIRSFAPKVSLLASPYARPEDLGVARDATILVAPRNLPGSAQVLDELKHLRAFCRCAVDVSTIDLNLTKSRNITVTRSVASFGPAVAELGLGMMLWLARDIVNLSADRPDYYHSAPPPGKELRGATVGIVGYGVIGREMAGLCDKLGMNVLICDPAAARSTILNEGSFASFDSLLTRSDYVVSAVSSTPQTAGLFDRRAFSEMKNGAVFINLARGEVVDEDALEEALSAKLAGAGLDVGTGADQRPNRRFLGLSNVVATPHIGGVTGASRRRQSLVCADQVVCILHGLEPDGLVVSGGQDS